jgi:hypothetical protein
MLLHDLHAKGWIVRGTTGKSLTIIMDNCTGQNKNRMVLRLPLYLVEMKYFLEVTIMFYMKGHTKNPCDQLFDEMKQEYRINQVYTFGQLVELLDAGEHVNVHKFSSDRFLDVCDFLDAFYKAPAPGTISKNHIVWAEASQPTVLRTKTCRDSEENPPQQFKLGNVEQQLQIQAMMQHEVKKLMPPGLREIKQVDLYTKY